MSMATEAVTERPAHADPVAVVLPAADTVAGTLSATGTAGGGGGAERPRNVKWDDPEVVHLLLREGETPHRPMGPCPW